MVNEAPWNFKNHQLVFHRLKVEEDLVMVLIMFSACWIKLHGIPLNLFFEAMTKQLGDFVGEFLEYDAKSVSKGLRNFMRIRVMLDVRRPLR